MEIQEKHYDVFLSYSREETELVQRFAARLSDAGYASWYDHTTIGAGDNWVDAINRGLGRSEVCLVLFGAAARGNWSSAEASAALELAISGGGGPGSLRVVPVVLPGAAERNGDVDTSEWPPLLRTLDWVDLRPGIEDDEAFEELLDVLSPSPSGAPADVECPYPGLATFTAGNSKWFFGRDDEIDDLIARVQAHRFTSVSGASGAGKSSLVRAGLIPRLSSTHRIAITRPRDGPFSWLRADLRRAGVSFGQVDDIGTMPGALREVGIELAGEAELLLFVDQFEELYAHDPATQNQYIAELLALSADRGPGRVIIAVRGDFMARAAENPGLAAAITGNNILVAPLAGDSLRKAIETPAYDVGLEFHAGLVDRIISDVQSEPNSLPLLAHLLQRLCDRRRRNRLTLPAYETLGGVRETLAQTADATLETLGPDRRRLAQRVLLRLTAPGDGTEDTRSAAAFTSLITVQGEEDVVNEVVQSLVDARLLVSDRHPETGERTVDVVHESLIRSWPTLRGWISEHRDALRISRAVETDTRAWLRSGADESYLYRGSQLTQVIEILDYDPPLLNVDERRFIDESMTSEQQRFEAEAAGAALVKRREDRLRLLTRSLAGAAVVLLVVLALLGFAETQRRRADANERVARASGLAAESTRRLANERDLAVLLAVEAINLDDTGTGPLGALLDTLTQSPLPFVMISDLPAAVTSLDVDEPTETAVLGLASGSVVVIPLNDTDRARLFRVHQPYPVSRALWTNPDTIVTGGEDGQVVLISLATDKRETLRSAGSGIGDLAVHNDLVVAADVEGKIELWRLPETNPVAEWMVDSARPKVAIGADGWTLIIGTETGVLVGDLNDSAVPLRPLTPPGDQVTALGVDRVSNTLAVGDAAGRVTQWRLHDSEQSGTPLQTNFGPAATLTYTRDGERLLAGTGGATPRILVWDAGTGAAVGLPLWSKPTGTELEAILDRGRADGDPVAGLALGADAEILAGQGSKLTRWMTAVAPGLQLATADQERAVVSIATSGEAPVVSYSKGTPVASSDGGSLVISGDETGRVTLSGAAVSGSPATELDGAIAAVAASDDGLVAAAGSGLGEVRVWLNASWLSDQVEGSVTALAVKPDGTAVAVAYEADTPHIAVFQVADGSLERRGDFPQAHTLTIDSLIFDPVTDRLISGSDDRTMIVWDVATLQERQRLRGHTDRIWDIAFTADGAAFVSASEDGTFRFWWRVPGGFVALGQPIVAGSTARAVTATPDGTLLVGYADRVDEWVTTRAEWLTLACAVAGRGLTVAEAEEYLGIAAPAGDPCTVAVTPR